MAANDTQASTGSGQEERFALRTRPGGAWEIAALVAALAIRFGLFFILALVLVAVFGYLLELALSTVLGPFEGPGLLELLGRVERLMAWLAAFCVLVLMLQFWPRIWSVRTDDAGLALLSRAGRTVRAIPRRQIIGVARCSPWRFFLRLMWPGFPPGVAGPCLALGGWYRVRSARRTLFLAAVDAVRFERWIEGAAGTPRDELLRQAGTDAWAAAQAGLLVSLVAISAMACQATGNLLALNELTYDHASAYLSQFATRNMRTGREADPKAWTAVLERALASGNPEVVQAIIGNGSRDGLFDLVGYDARNAPCPRSLAKYVKEVSRFSSHAEARRQSSPRLDEVLGRAEPTLRIADEGALERFKAVLERPGARRTCMAKGGYVYYFNGVGASAGAGMRAADALENAVMSGDAPLVERLLKAGASLEQRNWLGQTPLMIALQHRQVDIAKLLLQRGADVAATDKAGRSAAFYAVRDGLEGIVSPASIEAQIDAKTVLGETFLHAAVASGNVELVRKLLGRGMSVKTTTADGRSLLHYARGTHMVLMLLDLGLEINGRDLGGRTPLHHVVLDVGRISRVAGAGGVPVVAFDTAATLIAAGADRTIADVEGRTPAGWYAHMLESDAASPRPAAAAARERRRIEAWKWLLDSGTNIANVAGRRS